MAEGPLRVLVVEDEILVAMAIQDMLELLGHEIVATARRLAPALELAAEADFDVAMLDVNLDGELSFPVADLLASRGVPFFFATGYSSAGMIDRYRGHDSLQKPFRVCDLEQMLQSQFRPDPPAGTPGKDDEGAGDSAA